MSQFNSQAKSKSDLLLAFHPPPRLKPSKDGMISTLIGEVNQLHSVREFKYYFILQIPSQTHPEMFNQYSGNSMYQLS